MSKLSKRLEMVASFIDENDKSVIDIGCDHGLLSIYLAEKFNNLKIIASDVNNNALESARRNVSKYKLEDRIDIRLGSGVSVINKKDKINFLLYLCSLSRISVNHIIILIWLSEIVNIFFPHFRNLFLRETYVRNFSGIAY